MTEYVQSKYFQLEQTLESLLMGPFKKEDAVNGLETMKQIFFILFY